jgi:hypothetical protein
MRINRTVSSADAQVGENVDFETLDDVKLGDAVVIPQGSTALATITEAVPKRRMARGGKLAMNVDFVRLPNGEKLPLRGVQDVKGNSHTGAMTGAMVASAIVFFPAAPFFLFMKGKDIEIPKGHEVTVYTDSDYELSKAKSDSAVSGQGQISGTPLTNSDILKLKAVGLSDDLIVAKINAAPASFHLDTDDLVELKKAGIADSVVAAMIKASQRK